MHKPRITTENDGRRHTKAGKCLRAAAVLLCALLILPSCSHSEPIPDDMSEGISYLESLEARDPAEVIAEQARRASEKSTSESPETQAPPETVPVETTPEPSGDVTPPAETTPDSGQDVTQPPETAPPATDPPETAAPPTKISEEELTLEAWRQEAEQNAVRMLSAEELAWFADRLSDTVFVGDSITQALETEGVLPDELVFFTRGVILREIGPTLDRALAVYPKNVVFLKGLNDCDAEEPDTFIQRYADWVAYIRQTLPGARIYICSLLPPSKALGAVRPDLARSWEYDDALQAWCPSAGVTYINLHWLVYQHLYLSDGIHFTKSFYQLFLRYATVCIKGWEGVPR